MSNYEFMTFRVLRNFIWLFNLSPPPQKKNWGSNAPNGGGGVGGRKRIRGHFDYNWLTYVLFTILSFNGGKSSAWTAELRFCHHLYCSNIEHVRSDLSFFLYVCLKWYVQWTKGGGLLTNRI